MICPTATRLPTSDLQGCRNMSLRLYLLAFSYHVDFHIFVPPLQLLHGLFVLIQVSLTLLDFSLPTAVRKSVNEWVRAAQPAAALPAPTHWLDEPPLAARGCETSAPTHWLDEPPLAARGCETSAPTHWLDEPPLAARGCETSAPTHWLDEPPLVARGCETSAPTHWLDEPPLVARGCETSAPTHWLDEPPLVAR